MFNNYFLLAVRHLTRNSRYLLINMIGLGTALAFCILAYLNYDFANTFDHWHRQADQIFRVEMIKDSNGETYGVCPPAIGPAAVAALPGVADQCRYDSRGTVVKYGDQVFNEQLYFADENFFQFFDFEVFAGNPNLRDRNTVVIDETAAKKYFGASNPIGQTLLFYADTDFRLPLTVSAVMRTLPLNSSLRFQFLTHLDNQLDGGKRIDYNQWKWSIDAVFLQLRNPKEAPAIASSLQQFAAPRNTARPDWMVSGYYLENLKDLSDNSMTLRSNALMEGVPPASIWGLAAMSIMLLLTASLNFANMTIAVCNRRLREMGVRKVMGGTRFQLMRQLLGENLIVVLLASAFGMALAYPIVDWFNSTWQFIDLRVDYTNIKLLGFVAGAALLTTLLAGSYPAFYLASFQPSSIFRGGVLFGGNNYFSRLMMGLQVAISLVAVISGLSFARNAEFNRSADIGLDYQPILQAWLPAPGDYQRFSDAVRDIPGIEATAASQHLPGFGYNLFEFNWQGEGKEAVVFQVGNDFPQIMGMRLVKGNWPAPAGDTVFSNEIVVNQYFVNEIAGNQNVIGQEITLNKQQVRITGIVEDFLIETPFVPMRPAVLYPAPMRNMQRLLIKTTTQAEQPKVMASLESKWKSLFPYTPFNVGYQNEMMREAIEVSENVVYNMAVFAGMAVLLSITGLFSLVSLNVLRRKREVAIRRVLGASSGHIAWVLNSSYGIIFLVAVAIGCFGGYYMAIMLMDSIFKINVGVQALTLAYGSLGILAVAAITIGLKLWQTLKSNPADVLRAES